MSQYDSYSRHEVLDRIFTINQTISNCLHDHPFLIGKPEIKDKIMDVLTDMHEIYCDVAECEVEEGENV